MGSVNGFIMNSSFFFVDYQKGEKGEEGMGFATNFQRHKKTFCFFFLLILHLYFVT